MTRGGREYIISDMLKDGERLDDLECGGYFVIQSENGYCFTSDSVLLSDLAVVRQKDRVVDLCTGSGVIPILTYAKYRPREIIGVELQARLADSARRSVILNGLEDRIRILHRPVQGVADEIGAGFDAVTANPPYEDALDDRVPTERDICRAEYRLTLEETIAESARLLKYGGALYLIHRTRRLCEAVACMKKYGIEPKRIHFAYPKSDRASDTFVALGRLGGKPGLTVPAPIIAHDASGAYAERARRQCGK